MQAEFIERLSHPHNLFLQIWVDTGIVGLLSFLWLFSAVFYGAIKSWRLSKASYEKTLLLSMVASLVSIFSHGLGDFCDLDDGIVTFTAHAKARITWQAEAGYATWNVYRGDLAVLKATGVYTQAPGSNTIAARFSDLAATSLDDAATPEPGAAAFYLVTGENAGGEGPLGSRGDGSPRPNANPCP